MGYEVDDFQSEVIEASQKQPVVVDFWAPWCGPCRQLSPVLEELADEADDWSLVKVNTDENSTQARQYGVRGIPAVKLFVDGTVEAEFTGAKPKHFIQSWLEDNLPSESKSRIEQARQKLDEGRSEEAEQLLWPVLEEDPDHDEAQVLMSRALVFRDPKRATALADAADVADPTLLQTKEGVQTLSRLTAFADDPSGLPDGEGRDAYLDATEALASENLEEAVQHFIEVVQTNRDYDDDGARKACVALFTLLGPEHPITQQYRRRFDMALY